MKLGQAVEQTNSLIGRRDAFHVACVLCTWDEDCGVLPGAGMKVRFTGDAFSEVRQAKSEEVAHGVIDPFLAKNPARYDEMFWVLLMPGLADAPRHEFDLHICLDGDMRKGQWDCRDCPDDL